MKLRLLLVGVGVLAALAALALAPHQATTAASRTWPPFVLVAGLLLLGVVASAEGTFGAAGALLDRVPGGPAGLYLAAMALVATVTVLLNLDTSVAFLTPVLLHLAQRRGIGQERLLYGCVFMSNSASLLLPGSNLTNLLILGGSRVRGPRFLSAMALPWCATVVVTTVVVALAFPTRQVSPPAPRGAPPSPGLLSVAGVAVAMALVLALTDPAPLVLLLGLILASTALARHRLDLARLWAGIDILSLAGLFGVAMALGTVALVWSYPGKLMQRMGTAATAGIGALGSVLVNNLPATVLLGSRAPAHPTSLLLGLNVGPNLAVTGSLSALVWWQAARSLGVRPSARRYSAVGLVLVPLCLAAALAVGRPHF